MICTVRGSTSFISHLGTSPKGQRETTRYFGITSIHYKIPTSEFPNAKQEYQLLHNHLSVYKPYTFYTVGLYL
jgi:hypothetical protein